MTKTKRLPSYIIRMGAAHNDMLMHVGYSDYYMRQPLPSSTTKEGRKSLTVIAQAMCDHLGIRNKEPKARKRDKVEQMARMYGTGRTKARKVMA